MSRVPCPAYVAVAPDRTLHCDKPAGHGPADDIHHGLLLVSLPDGREHAASLVWSTTPSPHDEHNLGRAD